MILVTNDLRKTYSNGIQAVRGLSIQVEEGEIYGFLGPNGAGKSTSIKMLVGLLKPTAGTIKIFGKEVAGINREIRHLIGYVPQDLVFYGHLTPRENMNLFASCYGLKDSQERIDYLMNLLSIEEYASQKMSTLSGGQKRRVNLAIGLLNSPHLIFLDEPSAGMDPQSRKVLWDSIEKVSREENVTIILTSHLMETVDRLSNRVAIIDHGVVQVVDTPKNLKEQYGTGEMIQVQLDEAVDEITLNKICGYLKGKYPGTMCSRYTIKIPTVDAVDMLSEVVNDLTELVEKSKINQLSINETTLEDVFIKITGSELRE